ncbi:hypothetical protein KI659_16585 [Litoribacter alkaliphilus]|uniref:Glycosyl hydrolase family 76 n=1 Tax=Litoribacter ruber TaxID=702568 RepID=A0AAP2G2E3_9BACT|nr:glycoside hydrolase family 76 protein [Litoribacter alkaliphilus]MBS9525637.1 hypothetical protein [Litoribacter alkaliphilus]
MIKVTNYIILILLAGLVACNRDSLDDQLIKTDETDTSEGERLSFKDKAKATYDMIQTHYNEGDLYRENYPVQSGDNRYSYLWPYVGMLTAGNILYELGYDQSILEKEFIGLEAYYDAREKLPTYQAYPVSENTTDHYYDDSAIVAMELITAYRLTGNSFYLERAIEINEFIMSGEDSRLGGGLYWFEGESQGCQSGEFCIKAANTTAYASFVASELYLETQETHYLEFAKKTYEWNYNTLRDPSDNLYFNEIHITTRQINTTKWTYNAAMMIMAGLNLYRITHEEAYLDHCKVTAQSSFSRFTRVANDQLFYPPHDSWFNVELMTSFTELAEFDSNAKEYVRVFIRNLEYAWDHARNENGQFYEDWSGNNPGRYYWLLHQAALIEGYGRAAIFEQNQ